MYGPTLLINSTVQDIFIDPLNLIGYSDQSKSYLVIPVTFTFRIPAKNIFLDIVNFSIELKNADSNTVISSVQKLNDLSITEAEYKRNIEFRFPLEDKSVFIIENNRNGDAHFKIDLAMQFYFKRTIKSSSNIVLTIPHKPGVSTVSYNFTIPRSIWIEKMLPQLRSQNLKLIEIPIDHKNLKEAYNDIIIEFNHAHHYYNLQDYNKCVAHCRSTMDALTRNLKKVKENVASETAFNWLSNVSEETLQWIDKINKSTSALTSKAHHAGNSYSFTRYEAESIYLVVLGLLNFVGHLKP